MFSAELRYICGYHHVPTGGLTFLGEDTLIYLAGSVCVLQHVEKRTQRFLDIEGVTGPNLIKISSCRRYLAIACKATRNVEEPSPASIHIFDLNYLRKRKVLVCADADAMSYVSVDFSSDSKWVVALSGAPGYSLVLWQWDKGRVLACFTPPNIAANSTVLQVLFSPDDQNCVYTTGKFNMRQYRLAEGTYKQLNFQKFEYHHNYVCMCWIQKGILAVGNAAGFIHIYEGPEIKQEINVAETEEMGKGGALRPAALEPAKETLYDTTAKTETPAKPKKKSYPVEMLCAVKNALVCKQGPCQVAMLEQQTNKTYQLLRCVDLPVDEELMLARAEEQSGAATSPEERITWMTLGPDYENLACVTNLRRIMVFSVSNVDMFSPPIFQPLSHPQHARPPRSLDVCARKPLAATCGPDNNVYVWNYRSGELEFSKRYFVDVFSLALHPCGLYILIGFADHLSYNTLLMDDIRQVKSFPVKFCPDCCFSHGGHLFASISGLVVNVYSDVSLELVGTLKGHYAQITAIRFSRDDQTFFTCGHDGAVYEWNVFQALRVNENIIKSCQYKDLTLSPDGKTAFCLGSDRAVREIVKSTVEQTHGFPALDLTCLLVSKKGDFLAFGTTEGQLLMAKYPVTYASRFQEYSGHSTKLTRMRLSHTEQTLITCAEDCTLCVWKIFNKDAPPKKESEDRVLQTEEVLFTRKELLDCKERIQQLEREVQEITSEMQYNMRLKDMLNTQNIRSISDKYEAELNELNGKIAALQDERRGIISKFEERLMKEKEDHENDMQEEDAAFRQKLLDEYTRYDLLNVEYERSRGNNEGTMKKLEKYHQDRYDKMVEEKDNEIEELNQDKTAANEELFRIKEDNQEWQNQAEDDMDSEILEIKTTYEFQLKTERDANAALKGESTLLVKKLNNMKREVDELQTNIRKYQQEERKLQAVMKNLEKDITLLKKEISNRDSIIQEKEDLTYSLRREVQQVEKFNYVLKFNMEEVHKKLQPRERENHMLRAQIQNVENELNKFHFANRNFKRTIAELHSKVQFTERTAKKEKNKAFRLEVLLGRFRADLFVLSGLIQDPKKLADCVAQLNRKHLQETKRQHTGKSDPDLALAMEYQRQRYHLEMSVRTLRQRIRLDEEAHQSDYVRLLQDNSDLIKEITSMRRDLHISRSQAQDSDLIRGFTEAGLGVDAPSKWPDMLAMHKEMKELHALEVKGLENLISLQSASILKLKQYVVTLEKNVRSVFRRRTTVIDRKAMPLGKF